LSLAVSPVRSLGIIQTQFCVGIFASLKVVEGIRRHLAR